MRLKCLNEDCACNPTVIGFLLLHCTSCRTEDMVRYFLSLEPDLKDVCMVRSMYRDWPEAEQKTIKMMDDAIERMGGCGDVYEWYGVMLVQAIKKTLNK